MRQSFLLIAAVIAILTSCQRSDTLPTGDARTLRSDWGAVLPAAKHSELLRTCSRQPRWANRPLDASAR